ncbi:MAG: hypothetical protein N2037_05825 [Acidimicrobiales bacterium]|nr:hypothetical protein [Acidimicrobiales bacterium]
MLVDLTNEVRGLALWQVGEDLGELVVILFVGAIGGFVASVALSADRRRGVSAVGLGVMASAGFVLLVVAVVRHFALASLPDPDLRAALRATIDVITGDLRSEVVWMAGYGVLITAVANSAAGAGGRLSYRSMRDWVETHVVCTPQTRLRRVVRAGALLVAGFIVITNAALVVTAVVMVVGALLAYVGAVEVLSVIGRSPVYATVPLSGGPDRSASSATRAREPAV